VLTNPSPAAYLDRVTAGLPEGARRIVCAFARILLYAALKDGYSTWRDSSAEPYLCISQRAIAAECETGGIVRKGWRASRWAVRRWVAQAVEAGLCRVVQRRPHLATADVSPAGGQTGKIPEWQCNLYFVSAELEAAIRKAVHHAIWARSERRLLFARTGSNDATLAVSSDLREEKVLAESGGTGGKAVLEVVDPVSWLRRAVRALLEQGYDIGDAVRIAKAESGFT
jgi:hypothetical protein